MKKVIDYLKENPMLYVATIDGDQPRVRVFSAMAVFEDKIYICTNIKKDVYKQFISNPKTEICTMGKDGSWMRIAAKAIPDERREARVAMIEQNPNLASMYNVDDGIFTVLKLTDATATLYSLASAPEIITF